MLLNKALIFFEKILYPQCCVFCGKIIDKTICEECERKYNLEVKYKYIKKIQENVYFENQMYLFEYRDIVRKIIIDYKFRDKSYLYKYFSEKIIKNKKICRILKSYDIIIPVPIHKKRKNERGYNQSELIVRNLVDKFEHLKMENRAIRKIKNNKKQSSLNKEERLKNVQNVYEVINKERIENKRIILFDDIYTTGNTVNEISKLLKQNGVKEILVFTIAKD